MRDGSEIQAKIGSLSTLVAEAEAGNRNKWKDVWTEIKSIGHAFKEVTIVLSPRPRQPEAEK